jgi:N-acetylglucosamine kinase-like BadF-type ATPase
VGERVKVGGWGPVFGDEGSAYRIGQAALRAAARDFDGRGPHTVLTAEIAGELGIGEFKDAIRTVYQNELSLRDIAGLSRTADAVAQGGDKVAHGILRSAGEELAECAAAAIKKLGLSKARARVSFQGSVITSCEIMRESFVKKLVDHCPGALIIPPRFSPVVGAYLLGRTSLGLANDELLLSTLSKQYSDH